ncbi:MAG: DNA adenine methylase [Acetoanaerobium sp.]|nr:DNA adenine methylase [Acetoanaerobium sp.]
MFSYYGSKSKIVDYYPPPKHKRIIEPFAGSARYSLKYWQNDILLVDKYPVIVEVWNYLKNASESDIKGLPKLDTGQTIDDYDLSDIERKFMGFMVQDGTTGMRRTASYFAVKRMDEKFNFIIENLHKIKHWEIKLGSYDELENEEATWFIDPPYEFGGHEYKCSNKNIDFNKLAEWCKERNGQAIVCENTKATWLPFKPMKEMQGTMFKTTEAIWSNIKTNYDNEQILLQF